MTEIIIRHDGSVPNVDAMEACIEFAYRNYAGRKSEGHRNAIDITTKRKFKVMVTESEHPGKEESACSVIFKVENLKSQD